MHSPTASSRTGVVLGVEHETHYRYGAPVELAHHMAFLRPLDDARQRLEAFTLEIEPVPAHASDGRDRFGNARRFFTAAGAHHELRVLARSRVRLQPRTPWRPDTSPAWEVLRERLAYRAGCVYEPATEFAVPSPYIPRLDALRGYARASFTPGRPVAEAALDLMHRIHADFTYETASTTIETPLVRVLRERRGVCQDFAHLFVGACRMLGLAARYVSGYLLTQPPADAPLLIGADASHAWAAIWCPTGSGEDWLELDPTNDVVPDVDHVRVAVGRDFGDVAPLRGVIRGGGSHELAVRVTTRRWPDN